MITTTSASPTQRPSLWAAGLHELAEAYPARLRPYVFRELNRQIFHVGLVRQMIAPGGTVADIGGGTGLFAPGCATVGLATTLIDDFADPGNDTDDGVLELHRSLGVRIERRDVLTDGLGLAAGSMDMVTTFDSMEHWHHSPKGLFAEVMTSLKPGGWFLIGVPNCVNLRKRITTLLGVGKWSSMADWYEKPIFRGHVREPDVGDLRYIAHDMGLTSIRVMGRNWQGLASPKPLVRALAKMSDRVLRVRPSLCSDLYLLGQKSATASPSSVH